MHEFSIALSILEAVEQAIGARKHIETVHVTLGALSGISAHSLEFCFANLAERERFGSPRLEILELPARIHCRECDAVYEATEFDEGCPRCRSFHREILSGHECNVDWVSIEEDEDHATSP